MKQTYYLIFLLGVLSLYGCEGKKSKSTVIQQEVAFKKEGILKIYKSEGTLVKQLEIEIADNEYETQTGLMYRKAMNQNRGMLFVFPNSKLRAFYMKNTQFPLDIIYIDEDLKIVSFQENAQPFDEASLPSQVAAKYVLEINGGLAEQWGLDVGDSISFVQD
jgi:hypothetical protein